MAISSKSHLGPQFADPGAVAILLAAIWPVPEWAEPRFPAHPHDEGGLEAEPRVAEGGARPHSFAAAASPAAASCFAQILQSGPDASAVPAALAALDDYCFVLHELGDRDKHPPKAVAVFHSSMPLMRGLVEQGKLLTAAIGGLGKMGRPDLAHQVFDAGLAAGYGNTVFAHSALISAYARSGLAAEAMAVLDSMKSHGLKPTTISYNAVIDACGKGGVDLQLTLGFFREMIQHGLCPDRKTFNSLLVACSRAGHLEDARRVFDEMIHLGIWTSTVIFILTTRSDFLLWFPKSCFGFYIKCS